MFYTAKIVKAEDAWEVSFPDKPNVNTYGESREHAIEMAAEALNAVLECELADGKPLVKAAIKPNEAKGLVPISIDPCLEVSYMLFEARRGKTQGKVAQAAGITQQAYQRMESGSRCNPTIRTLQRVAKALGKRVEVRLV